MNRSPLQRQQKQQHILPHLFTVVYRHRRRFVLGIIASLLLSSFLIASLCLSTQFWETTLQSAAPSISTNETLPTIMCTGNHSAVNRSISLSLPTFPKVPSHYPRVFLGHNTGHAASLSVQEAIAKSGCPWRDDNQDNQDKNNDETLPFLIQQFEWTAPGERKWKHGNSSDVDSTIERSCHLTQKRLLPHLFQYMDATLQNRTNHEKQNLEPQPLDKSNVIFMDMGHFHSRGHVAECMAKILQHKLTLIRIRRNRHQIANSFAVKYVTPCLRDHEQINPPEIPLQRQRRRRRRISPALAICPRSGERIGPVYLKVPGGDAVWDAMTPFQHFLWYVDEMEYRWHAMQQYFDQEFGKGYNDNIDDKTPESNVNNLPPNLLEVTWSTPEDLQDGINHVRTSLGCTPIPNVPMTHNHTKSQHEAINCTDYILQDWQYQDIMQYTAETRNILLRPDLLLPLHLDSDKCVETRHQLDQFVAEHMPSSPNKRS
jgi:hypothetical protein